MGLFESFYDTNGDGHLSGFERVRYEEANTAYPGSQVPDLINDSYEARLANSRDDDDWDDDWDDDSDDDDWDDDSDDDDDDDDDEDDWDDDDIWDDDDEDDDDDEEDEDDDYF